MNFINHKIQRYFVLYILATILFSCQQTTNVAVSNYPDIEERVLKFLENKYYESEVKTIEYENPVPFNFDSLRATYMTPDIFSEDQKLIEMNSRLFEDLNEFRKDHVVANSMNFTFGIRERKLDSWAPHWSIVLLDSSNNVIEIMEYAP